MKCVDCNIEKDPQEWYAELTENGKIIRCHICGKKEYARRWKHHYGDKKMPSFKDLEIKDRIQHAKDLRNANLSGWTYRHEQKDNKGQDYDY